MRSANLAAHRLCGLEPGALAATTLGDLLGDDPAAEVLDTVRRGAQLNAAHLLVSGAYARPLEVVAWTSCLDEKTPLCVLVLADTIEQRQRERERAKVHATLIQSNKMEALGRLAAGVAHDFNNLLTVMLGATELLLDELPCAFRLREDVVAAHDAAQRAAALTRQLLLFSRGNGDRCSIDASEALRGSERLLRRVVGDAARVDLDLAHDVPAIRLDRGHLEQVTLNLLVNARDALPEGGRVLVRLRDRLVDTIEASTLDVPPGHFVSIEVQDDGCGMDEETRARAFEPFFTTKDATRGTGLGLATVYEIVTSAGGVVRLDSRPGEGTRVEVLFPVSDAKPERPTPTIALRRVAPDRCLSILLVDDDPAVRRVMLTTLARAGHRVVDAQNAGEAMLLAERPRPRFDLVISDVSMPYLSGAALVRRLRHAHPSLATLLVGGDSDEVQLPPDVAHLRKPFTPEALLRGVTRALLAAPHART
ncbi:MAG: response regulator [Myxococcales bacterium]|nr:response regulator [Myxococcales bacterium]